MRVLLIKRLSRSMWKTKLRLFTVIALISMSIWAGASMIEHTKNLDLIYEDFYDEIKTKTEDSPNQKSWFFSGYDCDSLAMESITDFVKFFLPFFQEKPNVEIELRTKSVAIKRILNFEPFDTCIIAFSFS